MTFKSDCLPAPYFQPSWIISNPIIFGSATVEVGTYIRNTYDILDMRKTFLYQIGLGILTFNYFFNKKGEVEENFKQMFDILS